MWYNVAYSRCREVGDFACFPLAPLGGGGTSTVGRERAEWHQKKEEEATRREAKQPVLFDF